ncbi:hypothetical protein [Actinomadura kijaniata]|uniref:hypothetical protein n=1 Tax=Actinomadura kijaniata TaxID=46161 RepID=UPI000A046E81|nr:hypothetical protein [Actinomadura kijaniata]
MTGIPEWEALQRLMPPTAEPDLSVDWGRMRESWGTEFPSDYRRFIGSYGPGTLQGYLVVQDPEPKGGPRRSRFGGMQHETANAERAWATDAKTPELAGARPRLIAWGADSSADILCWDASADDPDTWPVLVRDRDESLWSRYDCGMVEFLSRVLRAGFDECPLGDLSLWGRGSATFLPESEQRRRVEEGFDPWTGEPDPYAGMYGG